MLEVINTYLPRILEVALIALFGCLGMAVRNLAEKYLDTDTKKEVARTVVSFVEQVYQDIHGEEKLHKAMEQAAMLLSQKGLDFDQNEMWVMLEAAVNEMNQKAKKPPDAAEIAK